MKRNRTQGKRRRAVRTRKEVHTAKTKVKSTGLPKFIIDAMDRRLDAEYADAIRQMKAAFDRWNAHVALVEEDAQCAPGMKELRMASPSARGDGA